MAALATTGGGMHVLGSLGVWGSAGRDPVEGSEGFWGAGRAVAREVWMRIRRFAGSNCATVSVGSLFPPILGAHVALEGSCVMFCMS